MADPTNFEHQMIKLAKAAEGTTDNPVFVIREVFTAIYRQGFDDGHRAANRDDYARRYIQEHVKEASDG